MLTHNPAEMRRTPHARTYLFLIAVLGALLRLYGLGSQSMWYDEAYTLHSTRFVDLHGSLFSSAQCNEPPMLAVLSRLWLAVLHRIAPVPVTAESSDFLIRLLPCFFGVLAIPLVFFCGRALLKNERAALVASFLFAVSPFHIYYAQELRVYSVYLALSLAALICLIAAVERGELRFWAGLVVCESALMYSHYISVWSLLLFNVWLAIQAGLKPDLIRRWVVSQAAAGVLIVPALWQLYTAYGFVRRIEIPWYPETTWKSGLITFKNFFAGYGPAAWAYWPLFVMAVALFLIGLIFMARRWRTALLIGLLAIVPIMANILMWRDRVFSFYEHRVFMFSGVLALFAIAWALEKLRPRALGAAALAAFTAFTLPGLRDHYLHRLHPIDTHRLGVYDKGDFRGAAAYIREHWQASDLVCHGNHFAMYSMRYYLDVPQVRLATQNWEAPLFVKTHGNEALLRNHDVMPHKVESAVKDAERLWFIESQGITFEYKPLTIPIREWLDAHFERVEDHEFHGLSVTLYARRAPPPPQAGEKPNVVFILADTLRADRLGAQRNGVPIAPRLEALTRESVFFEDTLANCSWTKPSMATIFTSLHVDVHQVHFSAREEDTGLTTTDVLADQFDTIAEVFARNGYDRFGVQTNANLTRENGFAQGFQEDHYVFANGARADWVTGQALAALARVDSPFFLYVHYMDPHAPYEAPEAYRALYGPEPALPESDRALLSHFMDYYMDRALTACGVRGAPELGDLTPEGKEHVRRLYDAEVRFMDEQIGVLLDGLDRSFPNTIVVVAADHGEEFWEHEGMGHGTALYQEHLRVPLIWRAPGLAPRNNPNRAGLIDILPTLAAQLGFDRNDIWQGADLFGTSAHHAPPRFSRTYGPWKDLGLDSESVSSEPMKLIRDRRDGAHDLYNVETDPLEKTDVAAAQPEEAETLDTILDQHRATNAALAGCVASPQSPLTPEEKEKLEAIGYADS